MKHLKLFFALFAMLALGVGNAWGETYKLTKVTSVSAGEKYVFEQKGYVMTNKVTSSKLQCTNDYKKTGLSGTEAYVWMLEAADGGFYMKNVSLSTNQYLNNASSTNVSLGSMSSIWKFAFTNEIAVVQNTSNSNRFLGYTSTTAYEYKAYATSNISKPDYPHDITVYKLEVEAAPSYVITPTSNNDSWGTVSLSGAIINAEPKAGYCVSTSTPYEVKSGTATVTQNGNAFTVNASSDCIIQINFEALPTYTVTWIVNGDTKTLSPASVYKGDALGTLPILNPSDICTGKVFVGWTTEANKDYKHATDAPEYITEDTKPTGNTTYYAVFATEEGGGGSNGSVTITHESENFPSAYGSANTFTEYTLEGYKFKIQQIYDNGKMQWRAGGNSNGTGTLYNTEVFPGYISSIVIVYNDDNNKNISLKVGNTENPTSGEEITPTASSDTYTFDCSGGSYKYFVLTNGSGAGYTSSVTINYSSTTYSNYTTTCGAVTEPTLAANPTALDFETFKIGSDAPTKTITITGANLTSDVNLTVTAPFEIQGGNITLTPTDGAINQEITLVYNPTEGGEHSGTLTITSANSEVESKTVSLKGVAKAPCTVNIYVEGVQQNTTQYYQGDAITFPAVTACVGNAHVGWTATADYNNAAAPTDLCTSFTIPNDQTAELNFYAVYATVQGGGEVTSEDLFENNSTYNATNPATIDWTLSNVVSILQEQGTSTSAVNSSYDKDPRWYKSHVITITPSVNITKIVTKAQSSEYATALANSTYTNATATVNSDVVTITPTDGNEKITIKMGAQARLYTLTVTYASAATYSDYSTICAAAPTAEVDPTSVTATAAETTGKLTVTYDNVNTEDVTVALYNDAACTEAFTASWLTASIDADKYITYTVAATTLYTERKAYIQLTAPETTGATEPAVVVIPVTQAAKDKVFASLAELVAADLTKGDEVTVTLNNDVIKDFYIYSSKRCGVVFDVQKDGEDIKIFFNNQTTIVDWEVGGKLSGTLTNVKWTTYSNAWQLAPANTWAWVNLTYTAPATVASIAVSGTPTKTTYVDGEVFNPAGLVATATYTDATTEDVTNLVNWTFDPATLTKGQTSVNVVALLNSVSSPAYTVNGLIVNDIPTMTVAEFIAAGGVRCYLEGIVSGLTEGNSMKYGNFDLTDASGTIYVYGCLNDAGESQKFAELGVKNGDKIKVIADEYILYEGTKQEAIDVQYVSHISAATITIADITMEVGETKTIAATVVPAEAEVNYTIKENEANAISLSGNTITALAEGTATITVTVAEGATYLSNSVDFTVTVTPQNIAELPFEFTGGKADIENTLGMSQEGLGSDYTTAGVTTKLKFDHEDDYVIIHFNERPGILNYDIKANTGSGAFSGEFAVQESADGVTYRDLVKYTTISGSKEAKTHNCFDKDTRYIKFIFTTKGNGNVALGNIKIEKSVVTKVTPTIVENAYFSVGNNEYVQFSTGNLQYEVGTNTWSFAEEQYEVIGGEAYTGSNNTNYGMNVPGYTGKLDLFAWSCDGNFGVNPSNADADYKGEFADWGDLVNEAGWSTLTRAQMEYLLERKKDGKKLWGLATLEGKVALILLPDNWNTAIEFTYGYVPTKWNFTANELTKEEWDILEANGAVLLPAGGSRAGGSGNKIGFDGETEETETERLDANGDYFHVDNVGDYGYYWLSSTAGELADYLILPASDNTGANTYSPDVWSREKRRGNSVRLVKEVKPDYTRDNQTTGAYGTVCYPENIVWCEGATLYEVAGKEGNKVIFDEVTTPEAGMPYIFIAEQEKVNFFCGSANATEAGKHNSLQGTFTQINPAEDNILVGNYMLVNNIIKKCGKNCGLEANRAYFVATELEGLEAPQSQMPDRRRISLDVTSENTTTGLDNITNGENTTIKVIENGQLIIIRNGEKFNAQGIKL